MSTLAQLRALRQIAIDTHQEQIRHIERIISDYSGTPSPGGVRPGYCAPVANNKLKIWPGRWVDATGYARYYAYGWHTGADLNLNAPNWDADKHRPVYSVASGEVYAVRTNVRGWGTVICIIHDECLSRYAHCENIAVRQGETVEMGDYLGNIGNAGGRYPYHLHIDVARLNARMFKYPLDWPGEDKARVTRDYIDPAKFLRGEV